MKRITVKGFSLFLCIVLIVSAMGSPVYAAEKVRLNKTSVTLSVGESVTLKINGISIKSAKSSNKKVASVNSKGKVTAKKKGKATITVTGKNKKKYKCKVTVKKRDKYVGKYRTDGAYGDDTLVITKKNNTYNVKMLITRLCYLELSGHIKDGKLMVNGLDDNCEYISGVITKKGNHIKFTITETTWYYFDNIECFEFDA